MYETVYGNKYEGTKNLSTTEIAKLFREDVKAAVKAGTIPKVKLSVKTSYYSGGSSIDIKIKEVPADFRIYSEDYLREELENPHALHYHNPHHTTEAKALVKFLEQTIGAYNYDGSDSMVDYFHVRFYDHVKFDYELEARDRNVTTAKIKGA